MVEMICPYIVVLKQSEWQRRVTGSLSIDSEPLLGLLMNHMTTRARPRQVKLCDHFESMRTINGTLPSHRL